jgi:hypothetical protein
MEQEFYTKGVWTGSHPDLVPSTITIESYTNWRIRGEIGIEAAP